jgi:transposase
MAGSLPMEQKELLRGKVMELVKRRLITIREAAKELKISYRQGQRLYAAYIMEGDPGLIHGNIGKPSNRKMAEGIREQVLKAYREQYSDLGPTCAAEKIAEEHGIVISAETLRRWLIEEGLWEVKGRRCIYRSRKERRGYFGELIHFYGNNYDWFEGRRKPCCIMNMIDDATGIRYAQFFEAETEANAMGVLSYWIRKYGLPQLLYCDRKNAFILREATEEEQLKGITKPKSHFEKVCEKLGIEVIPACSPQAKRRVERNNGLDNDRLVKELQSAEISTIAEANRFLEETYLPKMTEKFSRPAADITDAHVPLGDVDLREIMCFEYKQMLTVTNNKGKRSPLKR